ncbi:MAG: hypothetical protein J6L71_01645 [Clostridia bacterium]|nr:hypothetical protein [Clostridia bacterium]
MAYCYNCRAQIPDDDKTKLCENCKVFMLPFVKFMSASTSSAVRRLLSNEQNLRRRGVTDSGMQYLLNICERHDDNKLREREAKNARLAAEAAAEAEAEAIRAEEARRNHRDYSDIELPMDEPLHLNKSGYGAHLLTAMVICLISAVALLAWFAVDFFVNNNTNVVAVIASIPAFAFAYAINVVRKTLHDLSEIKKRFR